MIFVSYFYSSLNMEFFSSLIGDIYINLCLTPPPTHPRTDACSDTYSLHLGLCGIPSMDEYVDDLRVGVATKWRLHIGESTRAACQHLCTTLYPVHCSSVMYVRNNHSCILSSYTGRGQLLPCRPGEEPHEFYLKHRCLCGFSSFGLAVYAMPFQQTHFMFHISMLSENEILGMLDNMLRQ